MKRDIIKISDYAVTLTGGNVWMTYWEIADAFNVVPASVNRAIKKLFKESTPPQSMNTVSTSDSKTATTHTFTALTL